MKGNKFNSQSANLIDVLIYFDLTLIITLIIFACQLRLQSSRINDMTTFSNKMTRQHSVIILTTLLLF
jgi:hypothetical protein